MLALYLSMKLNFTHFSCRLNNRLEEIISISSHGCTLVLGTEPYLSYSYKGFRMKLTANNSYLYLRLKLLEFKFRNITSTLALNLSKNPSLSNSVNVKIQSLSAFAKAEYDGELHFKWSFKYTLEPLALTLKRDSFGIRLLTNGIRISLKISESPSLRISYSIEC